ncbi:hypothetical protein ACTNES_07605 [Blautia sp. HCP3S3_D9]
MQIAGMIFQTRSKTATYKFSNTVFNASI